MIGGALLLLLSLASPSLSSDADIIEGSSHFVMASSLPAGGSKTFHFATPMLLYVSRADANQKYDTNIRFIDEKSGVKSNAWAAAQSTINGGVKKPVFPEARTEITIHNNNEHVFDDTLLPAIFYFVDPTTGSQIFEASSSIVRRESGSNGTITVMSAGMLIALTDFKFNEGSSVRLSAGGTFEVESDDNELITFDNAVLDANSWANVPLPLLTLTSSEGEAFAVSVSTKQAERSQAVVGSRTIVMSPGYPFDHIPSSDVKYSFKLVEEADIRVDYLGYLRLSTSTLEVVGSGPDGSQTYIQTYNVKTWKERVLNATFEAETVQVNIVHKMGTPAGVLVRIYTSSGVANLLSLTVLLALLVFTTGF